MSGHTPGPWIGMVNGKFNSDHDYCVEHTKALSLEYAPIWSNNEVVALVVHTQNTFNLRGHPSIDANAALIAAAPDLLAALQGLQAAVKSRGVISTVEALLKAEIVISKATRGGA
jgi:hypothetical protein